MTIAELIAAMKAGKTITNGTHTMTWARVLHWRPAEEAEKGEWIDKPEEWRVMS